MNPQTTNGAQGLSSAQWDEIHTVVQANLAPLAARIERFCPDVGRRAARMGSAIFLLFSYRTFEPPEAGGLEPVVVGVNFKAQGEGILIHGDICTEETGRILYDEGCQQEVACSFV